MTCLLLIGAGRAVACSTLEGALTPNDINTCAFDGKWVIKMMSDHHPNYLVLLLPMLAATEVNAIIVIMRNAEIIHCCIWHHVKSQRALAELLNTISAAGWTVWRMGLL